MFPLPAGTLYTTWYPMTGAVLDNCHVIVTDPAHDTVSSYDVAQQILMCSIEYFYRFKRYEIESDVQLAMCNL